MEMKIIMKKQDVLMAVREKRSASLSAVASYLHSQKKRWQEALSNGTRKGHILSHVKKMGFVRIWTENIFCAVFIMNGRKDVGTITAAMTRMYGMIGIKAS